MSEALRTRFPSLTLVTHPLAQHKLTYMRDVECSTSRFRQLMREVGVILAQEVLRDWPLRPASVTTPEKKHVRDATVLASKVVVVPILRSGLVLAEGAVDVLSVAHVGHLGLGRLPDNYENVIAYLIALPEPRDQLFILMDVVIGTGATACKAISILEDAGIQREFIRFATVLATPEGLSAVHEQFREVRIFAVATEQGIDAKTKHVLPGLGDTAARLFGL